MVRSKIFMYFCMFYVFYAILYLQFSHKNSQSDNPTKCHHSLHCPVTYSHSDITRFSSRWWKLLVRTVTAIDCFTVRHILRDVVVALWYITQGCQDPDRLRRSPVSTNLVTLSL